MAYHPLDLTGKKYLITGAASGLGKASSVLLSRLGAELILADLNEQGLEETMSQCHSPCMKLVVNLMDPAEIKEKVKSAAIAFGKINGMVHLAGRPYISPLKSISEKTTTDVYMLNTYAGIELAKVFTSKAVYAGHGGSIIYISSVYGVVGSAANVGYAMSKSALHGITKSLAIELAPKKIRVNCIAPGFVKTKMLEKVADNFNEDYNEILNKLHPLGLGEAEDIANAVAFLLSDMAKWITGSIMHVDGGFTAQ